MSKKTVVLTMYGKNDQVHNISVTLFDKASDYGGDQFAVSYCQNHNLLKLQNDEWMFSKIIEQNKKVLIKKPGVIEFDVIKKLNRDEIKMVCSVLSDFSVIASALKDGLIKESYLGNLLDEPLSSRPYWVNSIIEEYEKLGNVSAMQIQEYRQRVIEVIHQLVIAGKIDIDKKTE